MTDQLGPTPQHLFAFGAIIQWFARHEVLMQTAMAGISGTDLTLVVVFAAGLSYNGKKDALLSLTHTLALPDELVANIRSYLDSLHKHSKLRNAIAHSVWVQGTRPNAIKPMQMIVRGGIGKFIGHVEDERDYTPEELLQAAVDLGDTYNRFIEYLVAAKIIRDLDPIPNTPAES